MKGHVLRSNCLALLSTVFLLYFFSQSIYGQTILIQDESGVALTGVEVFKKDYSFVAISDLSGTVDISPVMDNDHITIRFLGFEERTITKEEAQLSSYVVTLLTTTELLDEIIVVGRNEARQDELPYQIETINTIAIRSGNSQTSADVLANSSNVYIQKSQMGGGSPVIRGFEANKVLLVVDGIRLNNAIYRNGHLQNAITVDQAMLQRMEVIYGPGSLIYGSDALGGVVHFKTRDPKFSQGKMTIAGNAYLRYASANEEKTGHVDINLGGRRLASLLSFSYSDLEDLRTGSRRGDKFPDFGKRPTFISTTDGEDMIVQNENPDLQVGTGYSQYDILHKLRFNLKEGSYFTSNIQYSTSSNVPRYDRLTEKSDGRLKFAEWFYGPQTRFLASVKFNDVNPTKLYDRLLIIPSYQFIEEDRIDRGYQIDRRARQEEDLNVYAVTIDLDKRWHQSSLNYGFDINYNTVDSKAYSENINGNEINFNELTRYPSAGSNMITSGLYTYITQSFSDQRHRINMGLRLSTTTLNIKYLTSDLIDWPQEYYNGLKSTNHALTGSIGWNFNDDKVSLRALVASAFRSPNIDDMAKIRVKGGEVTIPNVDLDPESSVSTEFTLGTSEMNKNYQASFTAFYTRLYDAIVRSSFNLPDGNDEIIDDGEVLKTVANVNAQSGYITGMSFNTKMRFLERIQFNTSINFTRGRAMLRGKESPLSHIPPIYGRVSLDYSLSTSISTGMVVKFNGQKPVDEYGDSTDNLDLATEDGTPAWTSWNLKLGYQKKGYSVSIGIDNIFDTHYRPFASGVSAPGRNLKITLSTRF